MKTPSKPVWVIFLGILFSYTSITSKACEFYKKDSICVLDIDLISQRGQFACWEASLEMINSEFKKYNSSSAFLTHSKQLSNLLGSYYTLKVTESSLELAWKTLKTSIS